MDRLTDEECYDIASKYQKEVCETGEIGKLVRAIRDAQLAKLPKPSDTARKIIKDVEDTLDITDDTYVRISNHVPFDAWQALKSRWGGE